MTHIPIAGILTPLAFLHRMAETGHWVGWVPCHCAPVPHAVLIWPNGSPWLPLFMEASEPWKGDFIACVQEHSKAQVSR